MAATATTAATLGACVERDISAIAPGTAGQHEMIIPATVNRDIDILFVIDNSSSMGGEQTSLLTNFHKLMQVLGDIEGGLPSIHIGVVSSNAGAGGAAVSKCGGNGDNGVLQNTPRGLAGACAGPQGYYISDIALPDGTRQTNYTGTLPETFACIAELGTTGCGYEQHLESMKRALDGSNPQNAGFLRPDAWLAVVIIADEDDCSASDPAIYDATDALDNNDSVLGTRSFRCIEWGVECDGKHVDRHAARTYELCTSRTDSPYIRQAREYAEFLKGLKNDPSKVLVAAIVGPPSPYGVGMVGSDPHLLTSCPEDSGSTAVPGARFKDFLDQFPDHNTLTSICDTDLSSGLTRIAQQMAQVVAHPCLSSAVDPTDLFPAVPGLQLQCQVNDVVGNQATAIRRCDMTEDATGAHPTADGARPCWWVATDSTCTGDSSGLLFQVEREVAPPSGANVVVNCVSR